MRELRNVEENTTILSASFSIPSFRTFATIVAAGRPERLIDGKGKGKREEVENDGEARKKKNRNKQKKKQWVGEIHKGGR